MADSKISALPALVTPSGVDLLLIIDDPLGTPVSKAISLNNLFSHISSNTSISGNTIFTGANNTFTKVTAHDVVSANGVVFTNSLTPANSSVSTIPTGKVFFDANFLYVKVSAGVIKRLALSSF